MITRFYRHPHTGILVEVLDPERHPAIHNRAIRAARCYHPTNPDGVEVTIDTRQLQPITQTQFIDGIAAIPRDPWS